MHLTITKETVMFASDFIFFLFLFDISTKESNVKVLHPFLPSLSHQQMFALYLKLISVCEDSLKIWSFMLHYTGMLSRQVLMMNVGDVVSGLKLNLWCVH